MSVYRGLWKRICSLFPLGRSVPNQADKIQNKEEQYPRFNPFCIVQNTAKRYPLRWRKSHKTIIRWIPCSTLRFAWAVLYFLSILISNTIDRYLSARTSKCGGRAANPDVANQWGPCHTGVSQQRTQGRAELQVSRQGHNAPVLVRSDGCNRVDS